MLRKIAHLFPQFLRFRRWGLNSFFSIHHSFFVLALLARTVQFKPTQCIAHKKTAIKIIYPGRTGPDRAGQCRPGLEKHADQGRAEWSRPGSGRDGQLGRDGQR